MATIEEDYCSFETAKLLKEKGFNEGCNSYFISDNEIALISNRRDFNNHGVYLSAPTLQMAMKWLREMHGLHISLEPCYDYESMHVVFLAFVQNVADVHEFMDGRKT